MRESDYQRMQKDQKAILGIGEAIRTVCNWLIDEMTDDDVDWERVLLALCAKAGIEIVRKNITAEDISFLLNIDERSITLPEKHSLMNVTMFFYYLAYVLIENCKQFMAITFSLHILNLIDRGNILLHEANIEIIRVQHLFDTKEL